jgi:hypothetical protein
LRFCACSALLTYSSSSLKVQDSWSSTYSDMQADSWSCVCMCECAGGWGGEDRAEGWVGGGDGRVGRGKSQGVHAASCMVGWSDSWFSTYNNMQADSWSCTR